MNKVKHLPLDKMTRQDTIDRYVAFGTYEDFEDIEVQKLFIKHDLIEWLIESVANIITDQAVIDDITTSNLFKSKEYRILRGTIKSIEITGNEDLPKGMYILTITIIGKSSKKEHKAEYLYTQAEQNYKNEMEQNIGNPIMAVVKYREKDDTPILCCLLKTNKGIIVRI